MDLNLDLTSTKEIMRPRIEALGYQLEDFDDIHIEAFYYLGEVNVEITDNLIDPEIEKPFIATFAHIVQVNEVNEDGDKNLKLSLPYIRAGMDFRHINMISHAIKNNDSEMLQQLDEVFSNKEISQERKYDMGYLVKLGGEYKQFFNPAFSDEEVIEARRRFAIANDHRPDPLAKFSDPKRLREIYGQN